MQKECTWEDGIIRDGFTQRAYLSEVEGLHSDVRFSFRPMLPEEVEEFEEKRDRAKAGEAPKIRMLLGKIISERVQAWSFKIDDQPAPVTELHARSIRPSLQMKMYNVIAGFAPTEIDPEWKTMDDDMVSLDELRATPMEQLGKS